MFSSTTYFQFRILELLIDFSVSFNNIVSMWEYFKIIIIFISDYDSTMKWGRLLDVRIF